MKKPNNSYGISNFTNAFKEIYDDSKAVVHYVLSSELNKGNQKFDINGFQDLKRPIVMFNHGLAGMWNEPTDPRETIKYVVGTNEWIVKANGYLKAKTIFDKDDDFSMDLYNAYAKGKFTDWSVRWNFLNDDKGRIQDGSFAEIEEDGGYVLQINKFIVEEYSAVMLGKDSLAVTEMVNSLNDFRSDQFKSYVSQVHLNSQVQNSEEVETLKTQIAELRTELETNKQEPFDKNGLITELTEYTNKAVLQATKQLTERIKDTNNKLEKVSKITLNNNKELSKLDSINSIIELSVRKEVNGVISQTLGQV